MDTEEVWGLAENCGQMKLQIPDRGGAGRTEAALKWKEIRTILYLVQYVQINGISVLIPLQNYTCN